MATEMEKGPVEVPTVTIVHKESIPHTNIGVLSTEAVFLVEIEGLASTPRIGLAVG